jgi:hypothetical protein
LEYTLLVATDLSFMDRKDYDRLTTALIGVRKMLNALANKLGS